MMGEDTYLWERGVYYASKRLHKFDYQFTYTWRHVPTGKGGTFTVYIGHATRATGERDFLRLLDHWNRTDDWRYHAVI